MASTIGIKIANGEFYPILEEYSAVKKRLILTTVHNKQASVHIDLYKSNTRTITDAFYIGSLVVENIKAKSKGDPSIELVVSSNKEGEISAEAVNLDASSAGNHHYLQVSLKSLEMDEELLDFILDSPPVGLYEQISDKKNLPVGVIILICLGLLLIGFILWFFLFSDFTKTEPITTNHAQPVVQPPEPEKITEVAPEPKNPPAPSLPPEELKTPSIPEENREPTEPPAPLPEITEGATPESSASLLVPKPLVIEAPASPPPRQTGSKRTRPRPPVASYKVPTTIPKGGVVYKIRWGDTLWDISEAFYRNPWLYPRIVRFNNIRNPDLIVSGQTIRIPPKR